MAESGDIEVYQPYFVFGQISHRSFYNNFVMLLCVDELDQLQLKSEQKHNKSTRWFIVFRDSVAQKEYRSMARLINTSRWG